MKYKPALSAIRVLQIYARRWDIINNKYECGEISREQYILEVSDLSVLADIGSELQDSTIECHIQCMKDVIISKTEND